MGATVFYASSAELATLSNTFAVDGTPTDPTTVALIVTGPAGTTTYTYSAGEITRDSAGVYRKDVPCAVSGPWSYVWVGTGSAADAAAGSWTVHSTALERNYVGLDVLKASLNISDTSRDALLLGNLAAAARMIDAHCGRRFYADQAASTRVFRVSAGARSERLIVVDDIASLTDLAVETGAGTTWTAVADGYEVGPDNALAIGQPLTVLYAATGAGWLTGVSQVRVTARWGWPAVPAEVAQATLIQATRLYRRKDSPEGVMGSAEWGAVRITRVDPDVQALTQHLVLPGFA